MRLYDRWVDLGATVTAEKAAPCGCSAFGYFERGVDLDPSDSPAARLVHGEAKLGLIPCSVEHAEIGRRVGEQWDAPGNSERFFNVPAVEAYMTLLQEALAA